jgi:hypothetical protein
MGAAVESASGLPRIGLRRRCFGDFHTTQRIFVGDYFSVARAHHVAATSESEQRIDTELSFACINVTGNQLRR